jgi:hypothetical protein
MVTKWLHKLKLFRIIVYQYIQNGHQNRDHLIKIQNDFNIYWCFS